MKALLKASIVTLFVLFSIVSIAQDFQGQAHYFSKTTIDMDNFGGREMSPEMKKMIAERMKSMFEKEYVLTFNREESIYKEEEVLEAPGSRGGWGMMSSFTGGPQYVGQQESVVTEAQPHGFLGQDQQPPAQHEVLQHSMQGSHDRTFVATAPSPAPGEGPVREKVNTTPPDQHHPTKNSIHRPARP